jgi:hypothetical protein
MESSIRICIGYQPAAILICLVGTPEIFIAVLGEIIFIDEIVSSVVWRVYIYELDLAQVGLLQELKRIEVVAFDKKVLRRIEVDTLVRARRSVFAMGALEARMASRFPGQSRWYRSRGPSTMLRESSWRNWSKSTALVTFP